MNIAKIARRASYVAVGIGYSSLTTKLVNKSYPDATPIVKIGVAAGAVVISAIIGAMAEEGIDTQIDVIASKIRSFKKK